MVSLGWALNQYYCGLIKRRNWETEAGRENVMWRWRQRLAEIASKVPEAGERPGADRSSLTASGGTKPANTLISDFQPSELWDNRFLLFKLPQLWYFVTEALANEYLYLNKRQIASLSEGIAQETGSNWSVTLMLQQKAVPVVLRNITICPRGAYGYRAQRKRACFSLVPCVLPNNNQKQNQCTRNLSQAFLEPSRGQK